MVDPITAAVAWVGAEVGGVIGANMIMYAGQIATVTAFSATIIGSKAMQRRAQAQARAAYNAALKDREVTIRSAIAPRRVIYGRDKVSGPLVYAQSTGDKGQFLHLVIALAAHECDAIEEIWFNDQLLPAPDVDGWITSGPFGLAETVSQISTADVAGDGTVTLPRAASRITFIGHPDGTNLYTGTHTPGTDTISGLPPGAAVAIGWEYDVSANKVRIRKHLGAAGQTADADLVAESGGKWTSAHKGTGICYLYVRLEYDPDMFGQTGVPNISCVVRGKKVLDPRTSTTAWTDNAALIAADWLKDQAYGLRATAGEVPSAEVIAAANICDETIALDGSGATQPRYTFNGSFTSDQSPRDVLEDLLTGMAGACVWTQGRWLLRPGAYRTPASGAEITEDDLAGPVSIQPRVSRSALFNAVRATYRDPDQKWAEVQAPLVSNATYVAQDGGVQVVRSIQLPGAMDAWRAQRLAKIELERARQAVSAQLATNYRAYDLAPTDTALVMLSRYGWGSGKVFEVQSRTWSPEGALQYTMRETAAAVYAWAYGEASAVDPAPDTDLPSPYVRPAAPASLALASGTAHLLQQADGTIVSRASVTWTASAQPFVQQGGSIEVQWMIVGADDWQSLPRLPGDAAQAYIAPVPDGRAIVVRVRAINAIGVRGGWSYVADVIVGKTAAPSTVAGLTATALPGGVAITVTPSTEADVVTGGALELRTGASWAAGTRIFRGPADRFVWPWPAAGSYTIRAKWIDSSGNESSADAAVSMTVGDSILLTSAQVNPSAASFEDSSAISGNTIGLSGVMSGSFPRLTSMQAGLIEYTVEATVTMTAVVADGSLTLLVSGSGSGSFIGDASPVFPFYLSDGAGHVYTIRHTVALATSGNGPWQIDPYFTASGTVAGNRFTINSMTARSRQFRVS